MRCPLKARLSSRIYPGQVALREQTHQYYLKDAASNCETELELGRSGCDFYRQTALFFGRCLAGVYAALYSTFLPIRAKNSST
jgi:hypothetical protein